MNKLRRRRNSARSYSEAGKSQPEVVNNLIRNLISKLDQLTQRGSSVAQMEGEV